jgi:hypothetical protein
MKNIHLLIQKYGISINILQLPHGVFDVRAIIEMYVLLPTNEL